METRIRESDLNSHDGEVRFRAFGHGESFAYPDGDLSQLDVPLEPRGRTTRLATSPRAAKHELALEE